MEIWFVFALISILFQAGMEISQKVSLTQKVELSAITNNFYVWAIQGAFGLIVTTIFGLWSFDFSFPSMLKLLALGIIYFLGGTFFYSSYKGNSSSLSVILGSISVLVSTTLGIIFFHESTTLLKFIGIVLILLSIFILNFSKSVRFSKYNIFALIGGMCFGVAFSIDKSFVLNGSPTLYLALMCFTVAVVSFIVRPKLIIVESRGLKLQNFYPIIISAVLGSLFNLFTFLAYSKNGNVGVIDAMNNSCVFLIILIEIIFLKDRTNLRKKIFCAINAFAGVMIFGLSRLS